MPAPIVTSISPTIGPSVGGTAVTLIGSGFSGATAVIFGLGTPAAGFSVISDSKIVCTTPEYSASVQGITVTTPSGISADTAADKFTFTVATYSWYYSSDQTSLTFTRNGSTEVINRPLITNNALTAISGGNNYYVNPSTGSDTNPGTQLSPFASFKPIYLLVVAGSVPYGSVINLVLGNQTIKCGWHGVASAGNTYSPTGSGSTYYVGPSGSDSNPGTMLSPFATLAHVDSLIGLGTIQAGSVIMVLNGTYSVSSTTFSNGGTSTNPIVYVTQSLNGVIFQWATNGATATLNQFNVVIMAGGVMFAFGSGAQNIIFDGFASQGFYDSNWVEVQYLAIAEANHSLNFSGNPLQQGEQYEACCFGFGNNPGPNLWLFNCLAYNALHTGFKDFPLSSFYGMQSCISIWNGTTADDHGIYEDSTVYIHGCVCSHNTGWGIQLEGTNDHILCCVTYGNGRAENVAGGMVLYHASHAVVYCNTFYELNSNTLQLSGTPADYNDIEYNIFLIGPGIGNPWGNNPGWNNAGNNNIVNNNICYDSVPNPTSPPGGSWGYPSSPFPNLGSNNPYEDPKFTSPSSANFSLQSTAPQAYWGAFPSFAYSSPPTPTVTAVISNFGPTNGGILVTVSGTNFSGIGFTTTAVNFGSIPSASYVINNLTTITALVPPQAAGVVDITVTTSNGTSGTSSADHFTYQSPLALSCNNNNSIPTGLVATITGSGGTPIQLSALRSSGVIGSNPFQVVGSRSGDGTINIGLPKGIWWLYARTISNISALSYVAVTNGLDEVPERILQAVISRITNLNLTAFKGIYGCLYMDWSAIKGYPAVVVSYMDVEEREGENTVNAFDEIGYPVLVGILDSTIGQVPAVDNTKRSLYTNSRYQMQQAFSQQHLIGVPESTRNTIENHKIADPNLPAWQYFVSSFVVRCFCRVPRGLGV